MPKLALFVKVKSLPGKREEVKNLWEKYIRPHSEHEEALDISFYCYAQEDENTVCLFELFSDPSRTKTVMQSDWFAAYQQELKSLIAGPPEVIMANPVWAKGVDI